MHSEYGEILNKLPDGFIPLEQWPEYGLYENIPKLFNPKRVGINGRGVRWNLGPLVFEKYVSDIEPTHEELYSDHLAPFRICIWSRISESDRHAGWISLSKKETRLEGIAEISPETDYTKSWSESARRHLRYWNRDLKDKEYVLVFPTIEEFSNAHNQSTVAKKGNMRAYDQLLNRWKTHSKDITLIAIKNLLTGELVAGMSILTSPSCIGSYYICGFMRSEGSRLSLMVPVMDAWFSLAQQNNIRFLHFGGFWCPGKPKNWKGFSQFKAKFATYYIVYQPDLIRVITGNIW
jgi:hypothetical protein